MQLAEDRAFKLFYRSIKTPKTKENYSSSLRMFKDFCKANSYQELLYDQDYKIIEDKLIDFLIYQSDRNLSEDYISRNLSAIKLFYEMNDIELKWKKIRRYISSNQEKKDDRPYTREELQKMIELGGIRHKVIISLCSSSGIRIGALPNMKYSDLEPIQDPYIYKITAYASDKKAKYTTFCTPECRKYIDEYMEFRKRCGETITNDSPLIREAFNRVKKKTVVNPRKVRIGQFTKLIRLVRRNAGIKSERGQTEVNETHGFRKYFNTVSKKAGVSPLYVEMMMGHSIGLDDVYFKPTHDDLLYGNDRTLGYVAAVNDLTIGDENRLKTENEKLKLQFSELEQVKRDMEKIKEWQKELDENK